MRMLKSHVVVVAAVVAFALVSVPPSVRAETRVGVAAVDITPGYPVRLSGFGFRRAESEGVTQRIWAKAIAFAGDDAAGGGANAGAGGPAVIIAVDNLGVPLYMTRDVAQRLRRKANLRPERLAITATHTHTAPMLKDVCPTLFGTPIPPEHQANIDRYTKELTEKLEQAALAALADLKPARVAFGIGAADLAKNRRQKGGPVDHDLPVLVVRNPDGKLRAVYTSYACHCVTLSNNRVSGDWAGFVREAVEKEHPGVVALTSVGCGADSNPTSDVTGDRVDVAAAQGKKIAMEIERLLKQELEPVEAPVTARAGQVELLFDTLPTREQWREKAKRDDAVGHHARVQLAKLDRGEKLQERLAYPIQTWAFGDRLAMVFLPGEVVVDYSLRLKKEFDRSRLWVNGYSNDAPCYIPSERVLKEGGYEGGDAMVYYDRPTKFAPGLEQKIIDEVRRQVPETFRAGARAGEARDVAAVAALILDASKTEAEREAAVAANPGMAAELIAHMTRDLRPGAAEYERIPWVWRVAVACGRRDDAAEMKRVLAVSLPQEGAPLRDWQAVVVGGGIINGLSNRGLWPAKRVADVLAGDDALQARWKRALDLASPMADDEKVPTGTRYDALRMLGVGPWDKRGAQLARYLARGTHEELQMGAVSGMADIDSPHATAALIGALRGLAEENRNLAVDALLRDKGRAAALMEAIRAGKVDRGWLGDERSRKLADLTR